MQEPGDWVWLNKMGAHQLILILGGVYGIDSNQLTTPGTTDSYTGNPLGNPVCRIGFGFYWFQTNSRLTIPGREAVQSACIGFAA